MPLLPHYTWLKLGDSKGKLTLFSAERAIGLLCEHGHIWAKQNGLGRLKHHDFKILELKCDNFQTWDANSQKWVDSERPCQVKLKEADEKLAKDLVQMQRAYLQDLAVNIHYVDLHLPVIKMSLDLVCDFSTASNYGIEGRLFVELKFYNQTGFAIKVSRAKAVLEKRFPEIQKQDKTIEGILLLVTSAEKLVGGVWHNPKIVGLFYTCSGGWGDISQERKARAPITTLHEIWRQLSWWEPETGPTTHRATMDDFLEKVQAST
jgi:hypothetical protein